MTMTALTTTTNVVDTTTTISVNDNPHG